MTLCLMLLEFGPPFPHCITECRARLAAASTMRSIRTQFVKGRFASEAYGHGARRAATGAMDLEDVIVGKISIDRWNCTGCVAGSAWSRDKRDKGKKKSKGREAPQVRAPPRHLAPLRNQPTTLDAPAGTLPVPQPVSSASMPVPSEGASHSSQHTSHNQHQMPPASAEGEHTHIPRQELDATQTEAHERPPSPYNDTVAEKRARKREKKLTKILDAMEHDRTTDRSSEEIKGMRIAARLVSRMINPFLSTHDALVFGQGNTEVTDDESSCDEDADEDETEDERASKLQVRNQERELRYQYAALLDIMPDLKTDIGILDDDQLVDYCARASRGDDTSAVRNDGILLLSDAATRPWPSYERAPPKLQKYQRGWNNTYTARLLCPQDMLHEFDKDPDAFCIAVLAGDKDITAAQYPCYLYDQKLVEEAPEDATEPGFLLSPLLLGFYKRVWTGRNSAFRTGARLGNTPGKPPISRTYNISRVHPRTIAYVAVLMRFVLSSQHQFQTVDDVGEFNNSEFFERIARLFRDPETPWCKEILAWWDREVYGAVSGTSKRKPGAAKETAADRLERLQKAERKQRRQAQREKSQHPSGSASPPLHGGGPSSD
ncbi:hypothetical protein BV20DRAFT_405450 [Pilatotrama ljubarskyi]|nr:hypothetical protein BV20DRAFT_405450 [Pilatotrama ljubarskyi]